jgi:hypothetical protein
MVLESEERQAGCNKFIFSVRSNYVGASESEPLYANTRPVFSFYASS